VVVVVVDAVASFTDVWWCEKANVLVGAVIGAVVVDRRVPCRFEVTLNLDNATGTTFSTPIGELL
jgi:hypothetical protein